MNKRQTEKAAQPTRLRQRQHTPKSPNIRGVFGTPRMFGDLGVCSFFRLANKRVRATARVAPTTLLLLISLISLLLSLTQSKALWAQSPSDTMPLANQLYEEGHFAEAAQSYQQLVDMGIEESSLYYNLGNAYFKQAELGRAILNYKRAAQLNPRDADIRTNLELARSQTTDQHEETDSSALSLLVSFTSTWLTSDEIALIALILWLLLILHLLLYRHSHRKRLRQAVRYSLLLISPLFVVALLSLSGRLYIEETKPAGVIVSESVDILSGPGEQYITQFTLHSGAEVILIEKRGTWARLTLPGDQLQGWLPAAAVEALNPKSND